MNRFSFLFSTTFLFLLFVACNNEEPTEKKSKYQEPVTESEEFHSHELGWTIQIPAGWTKISTAQTQAQQQKGMKMLEENSETNFDMSGLINVLGIQKNPMNLMQATAEPFNEEYPGQWSLNNQGVKEVIFTTFNSQGIRVDSTATFNVQVGGREFQSYSFVVYGPSGDVVLHQTLYSALINGYDFGVNINYNDTNLRNDMLGALMNSTFEQK